MTRTHKEASSIGHDMGSEDEIRTAEPPFDDDEADIIIRSSDNVDFHVFSLFLKYSSIVFRDMFHVAKGKPGREESKGGLRVIQTEESAATWNVILHLVYPTWGTDPLPPISLDEVVAILDASRKYEIEGVEKRLRKELIAPRLLETDPIRVFAIAYTRGLEAEARVAAKQTLHRPILGNSYVPELESLTAGVHYRLMEYHQQCCKVASDVTQNTSWMKQTRNQWRCGGSCGVGYFVAEYGSIWLCEYVQAAEAALKVRPCAATVIDPELTNATLKKATSCSECRVKAIINLKGFCEKFAAEVEKATSQVVLDIKL